MKKKKIKKSIKKNPFQKKLFDIEKRITKSYKNLSSHILKNSPYKTLKKESQELMMMLGEANYLAKECKRIKSKKK